MKKSIETKTTTALVVMDADSLKRISAKGVEKMRVALGGDMTLHYNSRKRYFTFRFADTGALKRASKIFTLTGIVAQEQKVYMR